MIFKIISFLKFAREKNQFRREKGCNKAFKVLIYLTDKIVTFLKSILKYRLGNDF